MRREKAKKGKVKKGRGEEVKRGKGKKRLYASVSSATPAASVSNSRNRQTTVSIIGAGRLGTALALSLSSSGYRVEAVVARRLAQAERAARLLKTPTLALSSKQLDKLPQSSIIFITTPDDLIATLAERLNLVEQSSHQTQKPSRASRTVLHASGALSSEILSPLRAANFDIGSLHPLVSVSDPLSGAESLREAFFCIEGDGGAVRVARKIVRDLGARAFSIKTQDKALYHAAAVMASGHMVALFDIAAEMLTACGLNAQKARSVLTPLTRSTLENLSRLEPARALTGTFARADIATVRKHLEALRSSALHDALAAYILLGQRSLRLAKEGGLDVELLDAIGRILSSK